MMVPFWNPRCSKQIPHLLTAVYNLEFRFLAITTCLYIAVVFFITLGTIFFCTNPKCKRFKVEHFSSKSSPNPRSTQRMSNFPMVWWFPFEIHAAVSRSHICLLDLLTAVYNLEFRFLAITTCLYIAIFLMMWGTIFFCKKTTCKGLKIWT